MPSTTQSLVNNVVLSATLADRSTGYVDQISNQIPLFYWLKKNGRYKSQAGGIRIERAVEYGQDTSEPSYQGFDTLILPEQDNVTIMIANWKQYYKTLVISGLDKRNNQGKKIFDLMDQKEANALASMEQQMNEHFYLDGTGNSSKRVTGLGAIIAENPDTGILFGINRATAGNEFWKNINKDTNAAYYTASGSVFTMAKDMFILWQQCGRLKVGGAKNRYPDLILCSETYMQYYEDTIRKIGQRFVDTDTANAGFANFKYNTATMINDVDCPADAGTDQKAFWINSRFMELVYHPDANFSWRGAQDAVDQDALSNILLWQGELISTCPAKHGIHQGLKAAA